MDGNQQMVDTLQKSGESRKVRSGSGNLLAYWLAFVGLYCCLGLVSGFFGFFEGTVILSNMFAFFAFLAMLPVWLFGLVFYCFAGFSRTLPRRPVFIMVWTLLLLMMGYIMLSIWLYAGFLHSTLSRVMFSVTLSGFLLNIVQLGIAVVCLVMAMKYRKEPYEIRPAKPLQFLAWNIIPMVFGVPLFVYFAMFLAVDSVSGGFMRLYPSGLYSVIRTYELGDKNVVLMGMVHVGSQDFFNYYANLAKSEEEMESCAVLVEGVTDNKELLEHKFSYSGVSKMLGLRSQVEVYNPKKKPRKNWIHADVDVSSFSDTTIKILKSMGKFLNTLNDPNQKPSLLNAFIRFNKMSSSWTEDDYSVFYHDVLDKRNEHLFSVMKKHLPNYETVIIPWGAAHLYGASKQLEQDGFHCVEERTRVIVRFY